MTGLSLNWPALCWIAMGTVCLTFGVVHLMLWTAQRSRLHYLFFAIAALASALFAAFELRMMQTTSLREMAFLLRWGHAILFFEIVALVGFIHWFFGTGRVWLAWAVVASRGLVLVVHFASEACCLTNECYPSTCCRFNGRRL